MASPPEIPNPGGWLSLLQRIGFSQFPRFFLGNLVQPVALVESAVGFTAIQPVFGTPASAGETAAPLANVRLANTGQLAIGTWTFFVVISANDANTFRVRRRNAADAADIWSQLFIKDILGPAIQFQIRCTLAQNERLVVENVGNAGPGTTYQASIFAVAG